MRIANMNGVRRVGLAGPQIPTPDAGVRGARRLFFPTTIYVNLQAIPRLKQEANGGITNNVEQDQ
jgi:hypothetical protein